MTSPNVVVEEMESFPRRAAQWLAETMARVLATRGHCAIALSGGTTPRPVYAALAAPDLAGGIAWNRVDVYFGDERAVPRDDAESNYRMAMEVLLTHVAIPEVRVHRIGFGLQQTLIDRNGLGILLLAPVKLGKIVVTQGAVRRGTQRSH